MQSQQLLIGRVSSNAMYGWVPLCQCFVIIFGDNSQKLYYLLLKLDLWIRI